MAFPSLYKDSFYQDTLKNNDERLTKFAYYRGLIVGAICARIEELKPECERNKSKPQRLYIVTLVVLASYRGRGVGSQLLTSVLDSCNGFPLLCEVALHVQVSNADAIRFYTTRFGFEHGAWVANYYKRLNPPHCYLLRKTLNKQDKYSDAEREVHHT